jgi:exopolysaccharide production protein ExoY
MFHMPSAARDIWSDGGLAQLIKAARDRVWRWQHKETIEAMLFRLQADSESDVGSPTGGFLKRGFDILGAGAALILLSPLFIMLALLLKLADGGSIFRGHRCVGQNGRAFHRLKFRTVEKIRDEGLAGHFAKKPQSHKEWIATVILETDPCDTRVGTVLRKLNLDELPQLINILRGDLSIVGPRPVDKDELHMYGSAAEYYLKSRPGLTGLRQISDGNEFSYDTLVAFDRNYVENWSFITDLKIIFKTVPIVLS